MMSSLMLLHDLLQDAGLLGGREAIVHGERSHTYGDLARAVEALAGRLAAAGVARGDRVAIYLPSPSRNASRSSPSAAPTPCSSPSTLR